MRRVPRSLGSRGPGTRARLERTLVVVVVAVVAIAALGSGVRAQAQAAAAVAQRGDFAAVARALDASEPPVRVLVVAALEASGLDLEGVDASRRRARHAAWLPVVRLRARRVRGQGASAQQSATSDRTSLSADYDDVLEATVTLRLDRLVYGPDEVAWARARDAVIERRRALVRQVIALYYERRRLQLTRDLGHALSIADGTRLLEIEALLDALTDGELGAWLRRRRAPAPGAPTSPARPSAGR
ncbi:MAG: hypothetical protein KC543_07485 [Myxococcales bacterium]|nr:hypothetical protein [Myxococcales bacterium]